MNSRYEVTLNGISLESLSPSILIIDVNYEPPQYEIETYTIVKRQGSRISRKHKEKAAVAIRFQVRAYDTVERQSIIQSIVSWARNGGDLRINDRPGQKLICVCDQLPAVESVRGWTEEMTISFAAYAIPYWQSVEETVATLHLEDGSSAALANIPYTSFDLYVPGNAPYNYIGMKWQSQSASNRTGLFDIYNANRDDGTFGCGGGTVLPNQGIMYRAVEYDSEAIPRIYQHIMNTQTSVESDQDIQNLLTGEDEVIVNCGETNTLMARFCVFYQESHGIKYYTPAECNIEFRVRGLWE